MSLTRLRITPRFDRERGFVYILSTVRPDGYTVEIESATKETVHMRVKDICAALDIKNVENGSAIGVCDAEN